MEFWIGVVGVFMAALGGFVSVYPPKERQHRIVSAVAFIAGGIVLIALIWIHTGDAAKEKQQALDAQKEDRVTLLQSQKEFREFRDRVSEIEKKAESDRSIRDGSIRDDLRKALGKFPQGQFPESATSNVPLTPRNDIPFKGGATYRLADLMKADGYTGTTVMAELYVQSGDTNPSAIRIGPQPDLNAKNSTVLEGGGDRMDYRNGADARGLYIRSDKDGKINITYRPR